MSALTLAGGTVVALDARGSLLPDTSVLIEDGQILDVRPGHVGHGEMIDCRGRIVMPGLVNAHAHALEGLFRGCGGELTLLPWIRRTHALMDRLDAAGARVAGMLAAAEMLRSGTTAYLDPEIPTDARFDGLVDGVLTAGIRAAVTLLIEDRGGYHHWSSRTGPALTARELELLDRWGAPGSGVTLFAGPSILSAVTPELGRAIRTVHDERGVGIAIHFGEVPEDLQDVQERGWASLVDFADEAGLLPAGAVLTHGVQLDESDLDRLAPLGVSLVHCPSSNAKLASGVAPVRAMLDRGLNVALGSDGAVCNDSYDLFAEMRLAALLQKVSRRDPAALSPTDVLRMATANGAAALGVPTGRLEAGLAADITVVDLARLGSWPTPNVLDSLVFATGAANVSDVLVGGTLRVRDGQLVGVDVPRLLDDAREVAQQAILEAGLEDEVRPAR
jgi:cytosine/adenosine deaminase-related metal-dependent hydrolase